MRYDDPEGDEFIRRNRFLRTIARVGYAASLVGVASCATIALVLVVAVFVGIAIAL